MYSGNVYLYRLNPTTINLYSVDPDGNLIYSQPKKIETVDLQSYTITPDEMVNFYDYKKPTENIVVDLTQAVLVGSKPEAQIDAYAVYTPIKRIGITVNYVDDAGKELYPPSTFHVKDVTTHTVTEFPAVFGYNEPDPMVLDLSAGVDVEVDAVYTPYTDAQWAELKQMTSLINFQHRQKTRRYYIGSYMPGEVSFDLSGFFTDLSGYTIELFYDSKMLDTDRIEIPHSNLVEKTEILDDRVIITLGDVQAGSSLGLPINWAFRKYQTPADTPTTIHAVLRNTEGRTVMVGDDIVFEGYYNKPVLEKDLLGSTNGYVSTDKLNSDGTISIDETFVYMFRLKDLERNIGSYTLLDTLPQYLDSEGNLQRATFYPEDNPDWLLLPDGVTVQYTQTFDPTLNPPLPQLTLRFPRAQQYKNLVNRAKLELVPHERPDTEQVIKVADTATHFVKERVAGGSRPFFTKDIYMPYTSRDGQAYFYDVDGQKQMEFWWSLSYTTADFTLPLDRLVITDYDLDSRMYYTALAISDRLIGCKLTAYDANGAVLSEASLAKSGRYDFPDTVQAQIAKFTIEYKEQIPVNVTDYLRVYTRLREPDAIHYDETPFSGQNVFRNYATAEGYTASGVTKVTGYDTSGDALVGPDHCRRERANLR